MLYVVNGFYVVYKKISTKNGETLWLPHFLVDGDWEIDDYIVDDVGCTSDCCISQRDIDECNLLDSESAEEINESLVQKTFDRWISIDQNKVEMTKKLLTNDFVNRSRFGEIKI